MLVRRLKTRHLPVRNPNAPATEKNADWNNRNPTFVNIVSFHLKGVAV
jgi:hypothetical protein